jgi:hypothetical protein
VPSNEQEERSYKERIDPGHEFGRQIEGLEALASLRPVNWLLKRSGVDPHELLDNVREQRGVYAELTESPERIAAALSPLGWIYFGSVPHDAYSEAAGLVEAGKGEEADQLLEHAWNENDVMLRWPAHRVFGLYGPDWDYDTGINRQRLLGEAVDLHFGGHYAGAISIVLAQIEGIFIDMTGRDAKYFFEKDNRHLLDDATLPGHSLGLKGLSKLMTTHVTRTRATGRLTRHGILHGRELGYDTRRNSTKVLAAALALIEWAQPKAEALQKQAAEERNRRYAGSKQVDEWGRRLDRRGFAEAQKLLQDVQHLQESYFLKNGQYVADRDALDRARVLVGDFELATSEDGNEYCAWVVTEPGVVFGLASRDGEFSNWEFVADEPPRGGLGIDDRWRNPYQGDEEYPDWLP